MLLASLKQGIVAAENLDVISNLDYNVFNNEANSEEEQFDDEEFLVVKLARSLHTTEPGPRGSGPYGKFIISNQRVIFLSSRQLAEIAIFRNWLDLLLASLAMVIARRKIERLVDDLDVSAFDSKSSWSLNLEFITACQAGTRGLYVEGQTDGRIQGFMVYGGNHFESEWFDLLECIEKAIEARLKTLRAS